MSDNTGERLLVSYASRTPVSTPVIFGPSMHNFAEASSLALAAGAAEQVPDAAQAVRAANALIEDRVRREAMSAAGQRLCTTHRGAVQKHIALCRKLLERR